MAIERAITVESLMGPEVTVIQGSQVPGTTNGDGAVRCVYLADGARLSGFTLTNGATRTELEQSRRHGGGGVWCESATSVVSNCLVLGNSALVGAGVYGGTLHNCTLTGNSASYGGGAYGGTLINCTLSDNLASGWGGGTFEGMLNNCIVYFNTASNWANYYSDSLNYCCTTPLPVGGTGNISLDPRFVDRGSGNLRLQSNSPCINAGLNTYSPGPKDLDGRPRVVAGAVDIGAFEFQGADMGEFIAWLQQYGLSTDGSADATDPDADGHTTWQEWRCRTDPTSALSALRLLSASPDGANLAVVWQSVAGVTYFLERSIDLSAAPSFTLLAPNLPGQPGTTSFIDTNATSLAPLIYRVGVGP